MAGKKKKRAGFLLVGSKSNTTFNDYSATAQAAIRKAEEYTRRGKLPPTKVWEALDAKAPEASSYLQRRKKSLKR